MNRQESQIMKGVAILLMLFLHLFNQTANVDLCMNFFFVDGVPLVNFMSRATNPVAFFLILGGYGLYTVWRKGDKHRYSRLLKLMLHYWIVLLIFVTIGHFMYPDRYPGNAMKIVENFTAFNTSYNGEMWFLLPYLILSLLSPYYFRFTEKIRARYLILGTFFINLCTSFCINRYGAAYLFGNMWIYNPLLVLHLLFDFTLGAMAVRCGVFQWCKEKASLVRPKCKCLIWAGIAMAFIIKCWFKYFFGYAFIMIALILVAPRWHWVNGVLSKLGDQSMNMWMIHSLFCYYLSHSFIYSFRYPVIIFLVLIGISYICSLLVNRIAIPIERQIMSRSEIREKPML